MSLGGMDSIGARLTNLASSSCQHSIAVIDSSSGDVLSFRALFDIASRVAYSLQSASFLVKHGDLIATSCRDGMDSVIAAYAIWLAGGVMVPIDVILNPNARVRQLLNDCNATSFIVADDAECDLILALIERKIYVNTIHTLSEKTGGAGALVDSSVECGVESNEKALDTGRDCEEAAYVVYTSGSTGDPKGVVCTHSNVLAYAKCKVEVESICTQSKVLLASHFSFDIWHGDLTSALIQGAAVVVSTRAHIQADLISIIAHAEVTHCCVTPTLWSISSSASSPAEVPSLQVLALGGEPMTQHVIDVWAEKVNLYNVYGATETTVFQTYSLMKKGDTPNKIGVPYACANIRVSDNDEIFISGECVSSIGYLNADTLTAEKFFVSDTHGLTFRTGDFGRYCHGDMDEDRGEPRGHGRRTNHSGEGAWYLSARDAREGGRDTILIKIRGHRVALGEVGTHVRACGAIADAVCTYDPPSSQLVAYLKLHPHSVDTHIEDIIVAVKATVLSRAPAHCVPTAFIPVKHVNWPLTVSGKTNKSVLIEAYHTKQWRFAYEPPSSGVESVVASAFERALGLGPNTVGHNDSFDALGGSSLNVLAVCRLLEKSIDLVYHPQHQIDAAQQVHQPTIGLEEGEASSLLQQNTHHNEDAACLFGIVTGVFAPCELLKRPAVSDYALFLSAQGVRFIGSDSLRRTDCGDSCGSNVKQRSSQGVGDRLSRTFISACGRGDVLLVQALLKVDSALHMVTECAPLHLAAASLAPTAIDVVRCLLQYGRGVDINQSNGRGTTVSHIAAARGNAIMLSELLRAGATPGAKDADKCTILHYAVRSGDAATVHVAAAAVCELQTRRGGLEQWDRWKRTAASWAIHLGFVELLDILNQYGAKLTHVEEDLRQSLSQPPPPPPPPHGEYSERTLVQRALRPERKKEASTEVLAALIKTMGEYANGCLDVDTGAQATSALRDLVCAHSGNREAARQLGAIPILVKLVHEFTDVSAIATLRNLPYRNATNAAACGDAGAIEVIAEVMQDYAPTNEGDVERNMRVPYACAAALHMLRYKCPANVKRIDAIAGLEDAIAALFKADDNIPD